MGPMPRAFKPGTLEFVQALGGQFAQAWLTSVPGGETLGSQRKSQVIKFRTNWHFDAEEEDRLTIEPSLGSQVIYLPGLVEGSLNCTFNKIEGRDSVQDILDRLPNVAGVRWIVGNLSKVCRVLANHLKNTRLDGGQHLLPNVYTWTMDRYKWSDSDDEGGGLSRLIVGSFDDDGVHVSDCRPGVGSGFIGLFVLGVPV